MGHGIEEENLEFDEPAYTSGPAARINIDSFGLFFDVNSYRMNVIVARTRAGNRIGQLDGNITDFGWPILLVLVNEFNIYMDHHVIGEADVQTKEFRI